MNQGKPFIHLWYNSHINSLFACKCDRVEKKFNRRLREMNVNISNEFAFSEVHGAMDRSELLAKLT